MTELIAKAKAGDEVAVNELLNQFEHLVRSVVLKHCYNGSEHEDLMQMGRMGIVKAIENYDANKGAFPSFVKLCVTGAVLNEVDHINTASNKAFSSYLPIDELTVADSYSALDVIIDKQLSEHIDYVTNNELTDVERNVFNMYQQGYRYKQISDKLSLSYKSVDGALQRAKRKQKNSR